MTDHWNAATNLPTPGIPLIVELEDGTKMSAIRPEYIESRKGCLGYVANGKQLRTVKWWRYE